MTKEQLLSFTEKIASIYEEGKIRAPVHFSKGNEDDLIKIFELIHKEDYVFSTWRSHYHALLHGVPEEWLLNEILSGHSITIQCPAHRFYTSAIVGSIAPMAVGVALGIKNRGGREKVWCFVGDMAAQTGIFYESLHYAIGHDLPVQFIIENNNLSVDTPTTKVWGTSDLGHLSEKDKVIFYNYNRDYPHMGSGKFINF